MISVNIFSLRNEEIKNIEEYKREFFAACSRLNEQIQLNKEILEENKKKKDEETSLEMVSICKLFRRLLI